MTASWVRPLLTSSLRTAVITPRQADVLTGAALGLTNAAIGRRLGMSEEAVKFHMRSMLAALGASNRTHAVALAMSGALHITVRFEGES